MTLNLVLTAKELFNIMIFTYLSETYMNNSTEEHLIKKSTFLARCLKMLRQVLEHKIKAFLFIKYLKTRKKLKIEELTFDSFKNNLLNGDIFYWKKQLIKKLSKDNNLNKLDYHNKEFLKFCNKESIAINKYLYRVLILSFDYLIEKEIFKHNMTRQRKRVYDYISLFDFQKFNKLGIICYLNNQIPMIIPPLDWDIN